MQYNICGKYTAHCIHRCANKGAQITPYEHMQSYTDGSKEYVQIYIQHAVTIRMVGTLNTLSTSALSISVTLEASVMPALMRVCKYMY